ncbi:MAG: carboxymuconolactone decarboxylase family protein [Janthinobacterium lividum]
MPSRLRYPEFAPEGVAAMRAVEHYLNATTALPAVLLEIVRLRVSLLNGCEFCIGHHTRELHKHNEPETRINAVQDWPNSDAFTPRERAALAWADSVTDIQGPHAADADYETAAVFFVGKDLVDLTLAISSINAWNRLSIAFRTEWDPTRGKSAAAPPRAVNPPSAALPPAVSVLNDDDGKVAQDA